MCIFGRPIRNCLLLALEVQSSPMEYMLIKAAYFAAIGISSKKRTIPLRVTRQNTNENIFIIMFDTQKGVRLPREIWPKSLWFGEEDNDDM